MKTFEVLKARLEEYKNIKENIIKEVRNLFRLEKLKKERNDAAIKDITNLFRLKKWNKAIKDRIARDIRNIFEHIEKKWITFTRTIILTIKAKVKEKQYQSKYILRKLDHHK